MQTICNRVYGQNDQITDYLKVWEPNKKNTSKTYLENL